MDAVLSPTQAPVRPPRLRLADQRAARTVLDGAWWPRSADAPTELADLVSALSARYGRIRHVILNGFAWTNHVRRLADGDRTLRIGWFASMSPALLVAITDADKQVDLLIVPASFDAGGASTLR